MIISRDNEVVLAEFGQLAEENPSMLLLHMDAFPRR